MVFQNEAYASRFHLLTNTHFENQDSKEDDGQQLPRTRKAVSQIKDHPQY